MLHLVVILGLGLLGNPAQNKGSLDGDDLLIPPGVEIIVKSTPRNLPTPQTFHQISPPTHTWIAWGADGNCYPGSECGNPLKEEGAQNGPITKVFGLSPLDGSELALHAGQKRSTLVKHCVETIHCHTHIEP